MNCGKAVVVTAVTKESEASVLRKPSAANLFLAVSLHAISAFRQNALQRWGDTSSGGEPRHSPVTAPRTGLDEPNSHSGLCAGSSADVNASESAAAILQEMNPYFSLVGPVSTDPFSSSACLTIKTHSAVLRVLRIRLSERSVRPRRHLLRA